SIVHVPDSENPQFPGVVLCRDRNSERAIEKIYVQLIHPAHLKNALGGSRAEKSHIGIPLVETKLHSVKAPLGSGESEIANRSLDDACVDQSGNGLILRLHFRAVQKREAAQPYLAFRREFESDERLLEETTGSVSNVAVGGVIRATQAELPRQPS